MGETISEPLVDETADVADEQESRPLPPGPRRSRFLPRLPILAWILVLLAVARFAWGIREAGFDSTTDPWQVGEAVLFGLPSVVSILLPAAILARHRDARRRVRVVVLGAILLAAVEGLRLLSGSLEPLFEWLTPPDQAAVLLVPAALTYQVVANLLGALAVAAMALGLAKARRFEDRSTTWPIAAVLSVFVVAIAVTGIVSVTRLSFDQLPTTPTVVIYIVSTVVLNVLSAAAFGYLAATLTAGARVGEDPAVGWRLAAIGSWLVIASLTALGLQGLAEPTPETAALMNDVFVVIEAIFAVGFVGLLGGFVLGLPSLATAADEEGDEDEDRDARLAEIAPGS